MKSPFEIASDIALSLQEQLRLAQVDNNLLEQEILELKALCQRAADALEVENRLLQEPAISTVMAELRKGG